jgi:cytidyltransferase-like protein
MMRVHREGTLSLPGSVVTVGAFDGVHRGHRALIRRAVKHAGRAGVPSVAYTFEPPPKAFFQDAPILTPLPEKVQPVHAGITFRDVSVEVRIANELTVSQSDRWKESRGEQTESFMRDHDSDKPSHAAGQKKPEAGKER